MRFRFESVIRDPWNRGVGIESGRGSRGPLETKRSDRPVAGHRAGVLASAARGRYVRHGLLRRVLGATLPVLALTACTGMPTAKESDARERVREVEARYRPGDARPELPELSASSSLDRFVLFAMLNRPQVEAAYYRWIASVEAITVSRSLPDPRLTFETDMVGLLDTLVTGLMFEFPAPWKLKAAGDIAASEAAVGYAEFEAEILRAAYDVKAAYYRLAFVEDTLAVLREGVALIEEVEAQARRQVTVGRASIQDVLRAEIEREQLSTRIINLEDSKRVLRAELALALGLDPAREAPPIPSHFEEQSRPGDESEILAIAAERNPRLKRMRAEVEKAAARLDLARASRVPDLSVGLGAQRMLDSFLYRPNVGVTLPIWRDKIAAEIAAARSSERAADADLTAEHFEIAAEFAALLYAYRESERNALLFGSVLRQKARQSLEAVRSGYAAGTATFLDVIEAERQLLDFETSWIDARAQRELSLASIALLVAGVAPVGAPVSESESRLESNPDAGASESEDP